MNFRLLAIQAVSLFVLLGCEGGGGSGNTAYIYPHWTSHWSLASYGSFDLRLFLGNKVRFDNPQGIARWQNSPVGDPVVLWVNSGQRTVVYGRIEPNLSWRGITSLFGQRIYGLPSQGDTLFRIPWGIAASADGSVFVADRGASRIVKLRHIGVSDEPGLKFERHIGSQGSDPGQFLDPRGVALVGKNLIAVVDNGLGRVTILTDEGDPVTFWEGLIDPVSISSAGGSGEGSVGGATIDFLIVVDSLDRRVTKFDLSGNVLKSVDATSWNLLLTPELSWSTIDGHQQVVIADRNNGCLHKLDSELNYITHFGGVGRNEFQFDQPRGIFADKASGKFFVIERDRIQTLLVAVDVPLFEAKVVKDSTWRDLAIDFRTTEPAQVELDVLNEYGQFIARIVGRRKFPVGPGHLSWGMIIPVTMPDGSPLPELPPPCKPGERLPVGSYVLKGSFRATTGSGNYFARETVAEFILD